MTDESKELITVPKFEMEASGSIPSFIKKGDLTGTEEIGANEIKLPRLAIAQGLSPQITPDSGSFIDGLKLFDLFNDLTGEIYGRGPLTFIPLQRSTVRIEFIPRKDGGGIKDMNVPANDPRCEWTEEEDPQTGKMVRKAPKATKFVEFVVFLIREGKTPEPIVLSIKTTNKWNRAAASRLSTFIKLRQAPIYSGYFSVASKSEKNDSGTFGVYTTGNVRMFNESEEPIFRKCEEFAANLKGKKIVTEREPGEDDVDDDDDTDFPPVTDPSQPQM